MEKIGVIILNYKVKDYTLKCLKSVEDSTYKNLEIIVVDNDSKDDLEEALEGEDSIHFIQNNDNLGYSGGNNVGIKKALEIGCELVFILNPDATVGKSTIEELLAGLKRNNAQLANPKIYFEDGKTIWYAGKSLDLDNVLARHRGVNEIDSGKYDQEEEMKDGVGTAFMVKKQVFEKIGFFDERYFLYYEESDFSYRAIRAGFKIMYIPKAVVYHANAKSTGLGSPLQDYFITRNRMLFASKFLPFRTKFALFREAFRNFANPVRRLAFFDFLTGNFGKGRFLK